MSSEFDEKLKKIPEAISKLLGKTVSDFSLLDSIKTNKKSLKGNETEFFVSFE